MHMNRQYIVGYKSGLHHVMQMKHYDATKFRNNIADANQAVSIIKHWGDLCKAIRPELQNVYNMLSKAYEQKDDLAFGDAMDEFDKIADYDTYGMEAMYLVYDAMCFLLGVDSPSRLPDAVTAPLAAGTDWMSQYGDLDDYFEHGGFSNSVGDEIEGLKYNLIKLAKVPDVIQDLIGNM